MKRKFIAVLLALSMVTTTSLCNTGINVYATEDGNNSTASVQKDGEIINGFKVIDSKYNEKTESTEISLQHVKTGAKMIVIKNNDKNRGFGIGFNTPSENNKGINHIVEHTLLSGSEKYPANDVCFSLANNTFSSFVNAETAQNTTIFPVCSQSEEQLMKSADVYMDCVYNPLVVKDKKIFEREAWRYELENADAPLTVNGIVYNEMKGRMSNLNRATLDNDKKALFADTNQKYNSGGDPDSILDLSYEEFLNTYKKNYHPSNSYMILYGDVDYAKFLKMIDENYLSKYDKKEFNEDRKIQGESDGLNEQNFDLPAAKDCQTTGAQIDVAFAMDDTRKLPEDDFCSLALLTKLLKDDSSDFMSALKKSNIGDDYSVSFSNDLYQPIMVISAKNADPSKNKDFYNLVMDELKKAADNGINKDRAEALIDSIKFSDALSNQKIASNKIEECAMNFVNYDDPTIDHTEYLKKLGDKLDSGIVEKTINDYLINSKRQALVTTTPKPGLIEENEEKLAQKLAEKKASMSSDEINNIVNETKVIKDWGEKGEDQSVTNSLKAVTSKDIPVEIQDYNISDKNVNGTRVVTSDINSSDIGYINIAFDESHLSKDELHYLEFYGDLLSNIMPTKNKDIDTLKDEIATKIANYGAGVSAMKDDASGDSAHAIFSIGSCIMKDGLSDGLNMYCDILTNSILDESSDKYIKDAISNEKQSFQSLSRSPIEYASLRAMAHNKIYYRYINYYQGVEYNNFILNLEKEYNENPQSVINKIKEVRDKAFSKNNLTVVFAGNSELQNDLNNDLHLFTDNMGDAKYEKASIDLPVPAKREALSANVQTQSVVIDSDLKDSDVTDNGSYKVLAKLLEQNLLISQLRLNGGAYTAAASVKDGVFSAVTDKDKDCFNSMNVIMNSGDYMNSFLPTITPEMLDNYIISTYAQENAPMPEFLGSLSALSDYVDHVTPADKKKLLEEIKSTDLNSLKDSPDLLNKLNANSNYVVAATPDAIEAHKDMFDNIIKLQ